MSQYLKVLKKLVCSAEVSAAINESKLYAHFISIGERIATSGLTGEIQPKMLVFIEHLLGFLANSVTASGDEAFAAQVLGDLFDASSLYESILDVDQILDEEIYHPLLVLMHNSFKRITHKSSLLPKVRLEIIFNKVEEASQGNLSDRITEWFTLTIVALLNSLPLVYQECFSACSRVKLLALAKNTLE